MRLHVLHCTTHSLCFSDSWIKVSAVALGEKPYQHYFR